MNEHKQSKFIIDVSAPAKRPNRSTTRFFSYDSHTAEIVIQAEKDGKLIDQALVDTVEIYFESVNMKYRPIDGLKWNDTMEIGTDGLYSYILPDDFLNYEGLVAFDVYINYKNGDKADSSNRIIFEQRVSAIDRAAGAVELVYIKDMEQAKQAVADKADEVMADMAGYESSLSDYEHQIKNDMDQLYDGVANTSADEITKIRAELPKVETAATEEITKIQAVLPDVQAAAADETAKIKAQLPIVEAVAVAETEKIQSELPIVQTVATEEIGKIRDVLPTVEQTAQEVSDHADQKIAEYDAKFVQSNQKLTQLQQSQTNLSTQLTETQKKITDASVFTKAESSENVVAKIDERNFVDAWKMADGTFTNVYPNENLFVTGKKMGEKIRKTKTNTYYIGLPTGIKIDPGKIYTLTWEYEHISGNDDESIVIGYGLEAGAMVREGSSSPISSKLVSFKAMETLPDNGDYLCIRFNRSQTQASSVYDYWNLKIEIVDSVGQSTVYTANPIDDYPNSFPKFKGQRLANSNNPDDYDWQYTDQYVDYAIAAYNRTLLTQLNDLAGRVSALESN